MFRFLSRNQIYAGLLLSSLACLSLSSFAKLTQSSANQAPAPEAEVFKPSVKVIDPNTVLLTWEVKAQNFLYKDRFRFEVGNSLTLGPIRLPGHHLSKHADGQSYHIYRQQVDIPLALLTDGAGKHWLAVTHQGCADGGFCYPPVTKCYTVYTDADGGITDISLDDKTSDKPTLDIPQSKPVPKPVAHFETLFHTHHPLWVIISFFGFGVLLSLTPCVLPMVPVLSGIIISQRHRQNKLMSLFLSSAYVLGMALAYAIIGIVVARMGQNIQTALQTPMALGLFACLYLLMALSLLDVFDIRLPGGWQNQITQLSGRFRNSAVLGVIAMGALSTLVLSPCVTAPLVGALGYLSNTGSPTLGGIALFTFGLGLGVPLLLVGMSTQLLPKTGTWMALVKHSAGFMLIGVSIYTIGRLLQPQMLMFAWSLLLLYIGFYTICGGPHAKAKRLMTYMMATLCFTFVGLQWIGIAMDHQNLFHPLKFPATPRSQTVSLANETTTPTVTNLHQLNTALVALKKHQAPVILDFYATWCVSCKIFESQILGSAKIQDALGNINIIRVDITKRNQDSRALEKAYNVVAPPTLIFVDGTGKEIDRLVGETSVSAFYDKIAQIKAQ